MDAINTFQILTNPIIWLVIALYFLPGLIALERGSHMRVLCVIINLFFGWTLIGWLACLIMAFLPTDQQIAHRNRVRRARDEFYLREQARALEPR